jgi:hypothetical protein
MSAVMDRLRSAFIGKRTRTVLRQEYGWKRCPFVMPADWDFRADNEWDFAADSVLRAWRNFLDQAERGERRIDEADVVALLRCQTRTFLLAKESLRGAEWLITAWDEIRTRTDQVPRAQRGGRPAPAEPRRARLLGAAAAVAIAAVLAFGSAAHAADYTYTPTDEDQRAIATRAGDQPSMAVLDSCVLRQAQSPLAATGGQRGWPIHRSSKPCSARP